MAHRGPVRRRTRSALCGALAGLLLGGRAIAADGAGGDAAAGTPSGASLAVVTASLPRDAEFAPRAGDDLRLERGPNLRLGVTPRIAVKLKAGFGVALARLESEPSCSELFAEFGADARRTLAQTLYYGATRQQEDARCRDAYAATQVGSAVTWVCRNFAGVGIEHAARVLIHEALHRAGKVESPQVPGAMTSREIDLMVAARCRL
jgi:hypothetical protein